MARRFRFTKTVIKKCVVALISLSFAFKDEEFYVLGHQFSTHSITLGVWKMLKLGELFPRITGKLRRGLEKIERGEAISAPKYPASTAIARVSFAKARTKVQRGIR